MEETGTENSKAVSTPMSHADLEELASVIQDNGDIQENGYMDDEGEKSSGPSRREPITLPKTNQMSIKLAGVCVFTHSEAFESMLLDDGTYREIPSRSSAMCSTMPIQCGSERHCHVCRQ